MASNVKNMQFFGQKRIYTSNHTCNQQAESKIFQQATEKSAQNSKVLVIFHLKKSHLHINFKKTPQVNYHGFRIRKF